MQLAAANMLAQALAATDSVGDRTRASLQVRAFHPLAHACCIIHLADVSVVAVEVSEPALRTARDCPNPASAQ